MEIEPAGGRELQNWPNYMEQIGNDLDCESLERHVVCYLSQYIQKITKSRRLTSGREMEQEEFYAGDDSKKFGRYKSELCLQKLQDNLCI